MAINDDNIMQACRDILEHFGDTANFYSDDKFPAENILVNIEREMTDDPDGFATQVNTEFYTIWGLRSDIDGKLPSPRAPGRNGDQFEVGDDVYEVTGIDSSRSDAWMFVCFARKISR